VIVISPVRKNKDVYGHSSAVRKKQEKNMLATMTYVQRLAEVREAWSPVHRLSGQRRMRRSRSIAAGGEQRMVTSSAYPTIWATAGASSATSYTCASATRTLSRWRRARIAACLALVLPISAFSAERALPMAASARAAARLDRSPNHLPWLDAVAACCTAPPLRGPRPRQVVATRTVSNCNDSGSGSLREAASLAQTGDLIDLSALTCSGISLTTGAIVLPVDDITLSGPGASALAIYADELSAVLSHTGHGVVGVYGLKLADGLSQGPGLPMGGCLSSAGSIIFDQAVAWRCASYDISYGQARGGALAAAGYVFVQDSRIFLSTAFSRYGYAYGGAIAAGGDVYLTDSQVYSNYALSEAGATVKGGGVFAIGNVVMNRSTIDSNVAGSGQLTRPSYGGGLFAYGIPSGARGTQIVSSTISQNLSHNVGALEILNGFGSYYPMSIVNSTIAYNYAAYRSGGVVTGTPTLVSNSTIAANASGSTATASGLEAYSITVTLQSTILAENYSGGTPYDFYAPVLEGANNLIMATLLELPVGTIRDDPQFGGFGLFGGPTFTFSLLSESPAIDQGNNYLSLAYDQRGAGYSRVFGSSADIGAFEVQQPLSAPVGAKDFAPNIVAVGDASVLTITLTNVNNVAATLTTDLVDSLPVSVVVADLADATTTCPSGTAVADPGTGTVTLDVGAQIPAASSCNVTVSVTGNVPGDYTNTIPAGALQTDQGDNTDPATAVLTVTATPPTLAKAFAPDTIGAGGVSTLTITLTNQNALAATLSTVLVDALPAPVVVANPPNASTTCAGGAVTADVGATTITLNAGAGIPLVGSCAITVAVTAEADGMYTNIIPAGALQTNFGGNGGPASALLTVTQGIPPDGIFADGFDGTPP
jgi:hypothetical protein